MKKKAQIDHLTSKKDRLTLKPNPSCLKENLSTLKGVGAEFFSSTRRLPAAARRRAVAHRGRADRQEQRRNRKKEPPKCEDCENSRTLNGLGAAVLICNRKKAARRQWQAVAPDDTCDNFKRSRELLAPELAAALAEGARLIPLTQGKFAIVDAADFDRLNQYKWHVLKHKNTSYARTQKNGKSIRMHRLITGAPSHLLVDHRDHNGLNNRRTNLRPCTHQENIYNRRPRPGSTSRYKGVYRTKKLKKYRANIRNNGKILSLGYFDDEIEAAVTYDIKAMEFFGEFAYLNFPNLMQRYKLVNSAA